MSTPTAIELAQQVQSQEVTATSLVEAAYQDIEKHDKELGAFISLTKELALETAQDVDNKAKAGDILPLLAGIPIAVKDNINVTGYATTCGSRILGSLDGNPYISPYDATVTQKLKTNGLPIIGKTNLDEFAMGSSGENSAIQQTKNPWDLTRVPGGSSAGSATAVSAGLAPLSLGSDTGGSVRQPASLCGLVGIKPTYGLVSRYGLVAYGSSLDQVSPFTSNVKDAAAILQVIAGHDSQDSTSVSAPEDKRDFLKNIDAGVEGMTIGVIKEFEPDGLQDDVAESYQQAIETYKNLGANVITVSIESIKQAISAYYIIGTAEASSNLSRFDGIRYGLRETGKDLNETYMLTRSKGFGAEVKRRIMLGTYALSAGFYDAYYGKAQKARQLLRKQFTEAFTQADVLICPTSPTTAFKIGEKSDDPVSMYLSDIATVPANMAGIPGINIPSGFGNDNMPIGVQLLGPHFSEATLFKTAQAFETETGLKNLRPKAYQTQPV